VLQPFLSKEIDLPIFRPADAVAERNQAKVAAYKPPKRVYDYRKTPSYKARAAAGLKAERYRDRWDVGAYRQAIARACEAAGVPVWTPHQLRHSAATRFRKTGGLDMAQRLLGHAHVSTTELYARIEEDQRVQKLLLKHG
jgi:integrase